MNMSDTDLLFTSTADDTVDIFQELFSLDPSVGALEDSGNLSATSSSVHGSRASSMKGDNDDNESTTTTGTKNTGKGRGKRSGAEDDASKWLDRRRQQIAKASKKARDKRKGEVMNLKQENKKLRVERQEFLNKINELEAKVRTYREKNTTNDQLENELLRTQLEEHKKFLRGVRYLTQGIPTTDAVKYALYKQGTQYALTHTFYLVSQSVNWKRTTLPKQGLEGEFKPDINCSCCHRFIHDSEGKCTKVELRIDVVFFDVDIEVCVDEYWKLWSEASNFAEVFGPKENNVDYELKPLLSENKVFESQKTERNTVNYDVDVQASYYREKQGDSPKDIVFLATKRRMDLAKSTLTLPSHLNPKLAFSYTAAKAPQVEKEKNDISVIPRGKCPCYVMARTTTEHVKVPGSDSANRISSMIVEGAVFYKDEVRVLDDVEINKDGTVPDGVHLCFVVSYPEDSGIELFKGVESFVTFDGTLAPRFATVLTNFARICKLKSAAKWAEQQV